MQNKIFFPIIVFILFCFPKSDFGQAPNLGIASNFALFTSVGAFNNTGATAVSGDVGTNVGAFNAFPPGVLMGQIHIADQVTAQAAINLNSAYKSLTNTSHQIIIRGIRNI